MSEKKAAPTKKAPSKRKKPDHAAIRKMKCNIDTPKMQNFIEQYALRPLSSAKFGELVGLSKSRVVTILKQEHVQKAIEAKRQEFFDQAIVSFKGLAGVSVDVFEEKLKEDRDLRAAIEVLKGLGIAVPHVNLGDMKLELHFPKSKHGSPKDWQNGAD